MLIFRSRLFKTVATAIFATATATGAIAADTVKFVVTFAPGGPSDTVARQLALSLREVTGKEYVVENKPGASGQIASQEVARSKPDGSVFLFTTGGHSTNAALYKKLPYDTLEDFTPISKLTESAGFILLVPPNSPYKTLEDLISAARATPGGLNYGSAGLGNTTHLVAALFERAIGAKMVHVPYKHAVVNDLMAGQIDLLFWGSNASLPMVKSGRVKALAITGSKRIDELPGVPAFAEKGLSEVSVPAWTGVFASKGMPRELVDSTYRDIAKAFSNKAFLDAIKSSGGNVALSSPNDFAEQVRREVTDYKKRLPSLGISME